MYSKFSICADIYIYVYLHMRVCSRKSQVGVITLPVINVTSGLDKSVSYVFWKCLCNQWKCWPLAVTDWITNWRRAKPLAKHQLLFLCQCPRGSACRSSLSGAVPMWINSKTKMADTCSLKIPSALELLQNS